MTVENGSYTFAMPANDVTIEATFVLTEEPVETYDITIGSVENGTVTADKQTAAEGETVTLTIVPKEGYSIGSVQVNGQAISATAGVYSFVMPAENVEVTVTFQLNDIETSYSITVQRASNGTIAANRTTAKAGEVVTVTAVPNYGYELSGIWYNGERLTAQNGIYSFVMPAEDVTVSASFTYVGSGSSSGGWWGGGSTSRPSEPTEPETPSGPTWEQVDGGWKLKGTDGSYLTGWQKVDGVWYYLRSNGMMVTGWFQDGTTWYYLKSNGAMATGWLKLGNTWYYLGANGAMRTGWLFDNVWYYLYDWGGMANTEWVKVGNTWYYFRGNGRMMTGWLQQGSTWYYLKSSGAMATGWNWVGDKCYYFNSSGKMAANTTVGGYRVNANGEWVR